MDEPGFTLREAHVCIVGLGLMGGSLALALRDRAADLAGVDSNAAVCAQAAARGIVRRAEVNLALVEEADLVVLAAPMRALIRLVREVGGIMRPGAALLDLGSVKQPVVAAMDRLPEHLGAVAGHPMCGRELAGLANADGALYHNARFVLCRTARTTDQAWALAGELIEAIGADKVEMDAAHHDQVAGAISHTPYILSAALASLAGQRAECDPAMWTLAASGFRDTSRLAESDPVMMADILLTNAPAVLRALGEAQAELNALAALIEDGEPERLLEALCRAQRHRRDWERSGSA